MYRSIQGEGIYIGIPTTFVRLYGCNFNCPWCDTKYAKKGNSISIKISALKEKVNEIMKDGDMLCITGGEPYMQKQELIPFLKFFENKEILIETNGSFCFLAKGVHHSISLRNTSDSLRKREVISKNLKGLGSKDEAKFLIGNEEDFNLLNSVFLKYCDNTNVIYSPIDDINKKKVFDWDVGSLVDKVLETDGTYRIILQQHKFIWGRERRK
jgi:7-carboxy-7-deazaguanine synthase